MPYNIIIERSALKTLKHIPKIDREKILSSIASLAETPRPVGAKKLTGREAWRLRIGNYRAIYEISDSICRILVLDIGHRKDIYK